MRLEILTAGLLAILLTTLAACGDDDPVAPDDTVPPPPERIAGKMFGEVVGENGIVIEDIVVEELRPVGDWADTPSDDPDFGGFAGSQSRLYEVDFRFAIPSQNLVLRSVGSVRFVTMNLGDSDEPDVRLIGIVDTTDGPTSVETHSWSDVRGHFR